MEEPFREAAEADALRLLKDKIHIAMHDAWKEFDYLGGEIKNVTPVVQDAVTVALSRAYKDITGDDLFPEEDKSSAKEAIFGESYRPF